MAERAASRRRMPLGAGAVVGLGLLLVFALAAALADWVAPYSYTQQNVANARRAPSAANLLGTDELGRDVLSRLIHGGRVSLSVAVVAQVLILLVGVPIGAAAGYFGGWVDGLVSRVMEVLFSFPDLLLIIVIVSSLRAAFSVEAAGGALVGLAAFDAAIGGLLGVFVSLALVSWLTVARIVRAQVASLKQREFVEAARASGATDSRVVARHLLPAVWPAVFVAATVGIPRVIVVEASLSFIGLGVQPPFPSWGAMILAGSNALRAGYPHLILAPAGALVLTVLACTLVGDSLGERRSQRRAGT
ncbi:MAG: ABC transporter permease [Chloroflexota bacterium]